METPTPSPAPTPTTTTPSESTAESVPGSCKAIGDGLVCLYAQLLPRFREVARSKGYALAVHGSMVRDLDLIAVPWIEAASSSWDLVEALREACVGFCPIAGRYESDQWVAVQQPEVRAHGRECWTIAFGGKPYVDLSVIPRRPRLEGDPPASEVASRLRYASRVIDKYEESHEDTASVLCPTKDVGEAIAELMRLSETASAYLDPLPPGNDRATPADPGRC